MIFEITRARSLSVLAWQNCFEAGVGDTVQLLSPNGEYWRFTVAAIARTGIGSIDVNPRLFACQGRTGVAATTFRGLDDHL